MTATPGPRESAAAPATPFSVRMRLELELTCDAFEDALSERSFVGLAGAIDRLQAWRTTYGITYEPFEGEANA